MWSRTSLVMIILLIPPGISPKWQQIYGLPAPQTTLGPDCEGKDNDKSFREVHNGIIISDNVDNWHLLDLSVTSYPPVCWLPCKRLAYWHDSRGPRPWCGRSSGVFPHGKPHTCRRDGHSSRSAPEPAGGEAHLVMRWGALDGERKQQHSETSVFGRS